MMLRISLFLILYDIPLVARAKVFDFNTKTSEVLQWNPYSNKPIPQLNTSTNPRLSERIFGASCTEAKSNAMDPNTPWNPPGILGNTTNHWVPARPPLPLGAGRSRSRSSVTKV